ncbi:MAG: hypothetical protein SFY67_01900 [Candidatus Melainabacteria bacterium]|nr:hypothetical protein [Candidatus Melainabacteria bacterium]
MKEMIIAFVLALGFSCAIFGSKSISSPQGTSIRNAVCQEDKPDIAEKKDITIGEVKVVDSDYEALAATQVKESGSQDSNIRFPAYGRFE